MLRKLIVRRTADSIDLSNRITIEVHTASFRTVRGFTVVAAIPDEVAFWHSEDSVNPDYEIVNAVRPAMATIPEPLLLGLSSPYAKKGVLWDAHHRHFGKEGDSILVWQGTTREMHPRVSESLIQEALEADEANARAEYFAEFRSDLADFLTRELVEACITPNRHRLPPLSGTSYVAFVDPSGGVGDSMALGIAHREGADDHGIGQETSVSARRPTGERSLSHSLHTRLR
jgi:hypothetical protein